MTGAVAEATHTARYPLVRWLKGAECLLTRVARRRVLSCFVVALVALGLRIALLPVLPIPTPVFQDEYSYLLGGETLAKGRLANPTHPMWRFFETMHVNMQPAYASKYPPGQAVFLALGIRLFGHPWFGVWLSMGLLCGCICWMLQGWIPPKYALIGGLLAVLQLGVSTYWVNSYWGGAVGACGGALVLGALPRLAHRPSTKSAVAAVLGVSILANTRPFEGGVTVLFSLLALLWWAHKLQRLRGLLDRRVVMPFMVGLLLTAGAI